MLIYSVLYLYLRLSPFDKDDQGSVASSVNKAPTVSKRFSTIFNQSPPDTPSLREQAFYVSSPTCDILLISPLKGVTLIDPCVTCVL